MPPWVPGEETKPAPMPLLLVQSFVNTWDGDHGSDLLLDPPAARDLADRGRPVDAPSAPPDPAELHLARGVREGIRAMLVANSGGPPARARRPAALAGRRARLPARAAGRPGRPGQPRPRARRPARRGAAHPAAG